MSLVHSQGANSIGLSACSSSVLFLLLEFEVDHLVDLLRTVAEQSLQVADKAVDVALPSCLQDYVLVIVVPAKDS